MFRDSLASLAVAMMALAGVGSLAFSLTLAASVATAPIV
jgi:hypothetical protein